MNKLIVLPGYSIKNKEWANEINDFLADEFDTTIHEWKHWKTGEGNDFSFESESSLIKEIIGDDEINVIAKSIGSATLAYMLPEVKNHIDKLILCGLPLNDLNQKEKDYYHSLRNFNPEKVIIFQNSNDDHGSYAQAVEFMRQINRDIKLIDKDRSDHHYPYYEYFKQFLTYGN